MTPGLIVFIYCILTYGICNILVFGHLPWYIMDKIRDFAMEHNPNFFGKMLSCMMCSSWWVGSLLSILNWFLLPDKGLTPGNLLLDGCNLWFIALFIDGFFTSGSVWLIHHIEEWFENNSGTIIEETDEDTINVDDITQD